MTSYTPVPKPSYEAWLLQENMAFLLLESGGKINISSVTLTEILKPATQVFSEITRPGQPSYTEVPKPA